MSDKTTGWFDCTATTMFGLEETLMAELTALGAKDLLKFTRAVSFRANNELLYKCNLWLRTALRVLKPIHKFQATNEEELYNGVKQVNWSEYMDVDGTLAIESAVNSEYFNHSQYVSLKTKDAIVDQFRNRAGRRPNVELTQPNLKIHIHIYRDQCTLSLDSSAESLHRRGYRQEQNMAPLNEALAAGMLLLAGWRGQSNFIDPMCGSGTILVEAAMIAKNIAPGLSREWFGFMGWNDYDPELFESIREEAVTAQREFRFRIQGSDMSTLAIGISRANIERAGLTGTIRVGCISFEDQIPPAGGGLMVMNPPYGERMELDDVTAFYKMFGDVFKQKYKGYECWVLTSNKEAIKMVGLRPSRKITLYNGSLECKFHCFSIYEGTKKNREPEKYPEEGGDMPKVEEA